MDRDVDEWALATILRGLAPFLSRGLLDRALAVARLIRDGHDLLEALCGLGPYLDDRARLEAAREALELAWRLDDDCTDDFYFARLLHELAPWLPDAAMEETLAAIAGPAFDVYDGVEVLTELMPYLPDFLKVPALEMIGATSAECLPFVGLSDIGRHLPPELAVRVYEAILERGDLGYHALALVQLAPRLPAEIRASGIDVALSAAQEVEIVSVRSDWIAELAPHLPPPVRTKAMAELLAAIRQVTDAGSRISALINIIPQLPEGIARDALHEAEIAVRDLKSIDVRLAMITKIVPLLPDAERNDALTEIFAFLKDRGKSPSRSVYVSKIVPFLSDSAQADAVAVLGELEQVQHRAHVMSNLAPCLGKQAQCQALAVVGGIADLASRATALHSFAVHFTGRQKIAAIHGLVDLLAGFARTAPPAGNAPAEIDEAVGRALDALSKNAKLH